METGTEDIPLLSLITFQARRRSLKLFACHCRNQKPIGYLHWAFDVAGAIPSLRNVIGWLSLVIISTPEFKTFEDSLFTDAKFKNKGVPEVRVLADVAESCRLRA